MKPRTAAAPSHAPAAHAARAEPQWQAWLGLTARVAVGVVMLVSGIHKASAPAEDFMVVLESYDILPEPHLRLFATLMPWAETLGGAFLLGGLFTRAAAATTGALGAAFFAALAYTKFRGIELPNCGCFGQAIHLERWQAMLLDVAVISLSVSAWHWGRRKLSLDGWVEAAPE